ncbi:MAG: hypothetical protein LBM75_06250 [Myxococcales bacterium]|jgi:hypothetical protein|nr:hypothetical protein [Myxococcales bacterium]
MGLIVGIAIPALISGIGSAAESEELILAGGGIAGSAFLILPPILFAGGNSARSDPRVRGLPGLRAVGWVMYGLTWGSLVASATAFAADSFDWGMGSAVAAGVFGVSSLLFFIIDDYVSAGQAARLLQREAGFAMAPTILPIGRASRIDGAALGFVGQF